MELATGNESKAPENATEAPFSLLIHGKQMI